MDKRWCHGRNIKEHPRSGELVHRSLCPGVQSSREGTRRGRSRVLRNAQPSAELWPGKAGAGKGPPWLCGSWMEGGHVLRSMVPDAAGAQKRM